MISLKALRLNTKDLIVVCVYLLLTLVTLSVTGCLATGEQLEWDEVKSEIRTAFPSVAQLSTRELAEWLAAESGPVPLLLDARASEEYAVSHLRGAISTPSVEAAREQVEKADEGRPIVIYCSVGYRSSRLAERLERLGYKNIYNLEGSIFEWANEGRAVFRGDRMVETVHPYDDDWGQLLEKHLWLKQVD